MHLLSYIRGISNFSVFHSFPSVRVDKISHYLCTFGNTQ